MNLFEKIVAHKKQIEQLKLMHQRSLVPHALVFVGNSGIGKRLVARAFAAELLRGATDDKQCSNLVSLGTHPDLHLIDLEPGKKDITVGSIRDACSILQLKPYNGIASVAIIDNAHLMNISAANSLLKTLEEPTNSSYLILVTDTPHRLPETITSRCQQMHFSPLSRNQLKQVISEKLIAEAAYEELTEELLELTTDSLESLCLDTIIDGQTLKPNSVKDLIEHLESLTKASAKVRKQLDSVLADFSSKATSASQAVVAVSELAQEKETLPLVWQILKTQIRNKMRSDPNQQATKHWADLLLKTISTEQLSRERSLNPQIQLCAILSH